MPAPTVTLTGRINDVIGDTPDPRRTKVYIMAVDGNGPIERISDSTWNEDRYAGATAVIDGTGTYIFDNLWPTNSPTANPTGFYYEVFIDYALHGPGRDRGRNLWRSGPFKLTATAHLSDLDLDTPAVSPTWRNGFRSEMQALLAAAGAAADLAVDISKISTTDAAVAALATLPGGQARSVFARKRTIDPRDFGVIGDGVANDTAGLQAALNAASGSFDGGVVELFKGTFKISAPLVMPAHVGLEGTGARSSIIWTGSNDIPAIYSESGQGEVIRNLKIRNSLTTGGSRNTYDIEFVNPTKPLIENVEIDLPNADTGGGGIRFSRDSTKPGNAYMPQLKGVWIRNGHLVSRGVSDGHFVEGWVWSPYSSQPGSINMSFHDGNSSDGWTFTSVDVGGTNTFGAGYLLTSVNHTKINGGYLDGHLGTFGLKAINSGRIFMSGFNFYQCGYSAIRLENTKGCVFSSVGFYKNNRAGAGYADIELIGSGFNTFQGTNHGQPTAHTNKGLVYKEDGSSEHNLLENAVIDLTLGNQYLAPYFTGNAGTLGDANRPPNLWPKRAEVPSVITPQATTVGIGTAATWPAANRAVFHRFYVPKGEGTGFRFANVRVEVASGNYQCAVVRMDGLNYTRVMASGVIATVVGGQSVDMGATHLPPGEYALVVWCDNATAQFYRTSGEVLRSFRLVGEVSSLASGVPASGSIPGWNGATIINGLSLTS